jgi:hypothetical protein
MNSYLNDETQIVMSFYKHAQTYVLAECYEQAILQAQMANKYLKN